MFSPLIRFFCGYNLRCRTLFINYLVYGHGLFVMFEHEFSKSNLGSKTYFCVFFNFYVFTSCAQFLNFSHFFLNITFYQFILNFHLNFCLVYTFLIIFYQTFRFTCFNLVENICLYVYWIFQTSDEKKNKFFCGDLKCFY